MLQYRYVFAAVISLLFCNNVASAQNDNPFMNDDIYLFQTPSHGNPYITNNVSIDIIKSKALQGDDIAQFALVKKEYQKAFYWYRKAAGQGQSQAQLKLGLMHYKGEGTSQNYLKAKEYY